MKNHYTKPRGWGAYTPQRVIDSQKGIGREGGRWVRPEPYWSLKTRLAQAWDVLTYKADALYWKEPNEK
jgi:hypothetical protein